jgi:flagellar biosynthesis/type III secretory pathway protein FliH
MGSLSRVRSGPAVSAIFPDLAPGGGRPPGAADPVAEAHGIIAGAERQAQALMESARRKAAAALEEARREGRLHGHAEGLAAARDGVRALDEALHAACARVRALDEEFRARAGQLVVELGLLLAERIVGAEIRRDPRLLFESARTAMAALPRADEYVVRLHPDSLGILQAERASLEAQADGAPVRFAADPAIPAGECVVETPQALADATLEGQLTEARRRLQGVAW